jgi:MFS family permease
MAIAVFYAIGTSLGGITGPVVFGQLIEAGGRGNIFVAYIIGAVFMIGAAIVELILGVRAEGKSLESVARPLTAIEEATGATA